MSPSEDGELWVLEAVRLNFSSVQIGGFPLPNNPKVAFLAVQATSHLSSKELKEKFGLEEMPFLPIAIYPTLAFPRWNIPQNFWLSLIHGLGKLLSCRFLKRVLSEISPRVIERFRKV
jgi:hypothetical protein